MKTSSIWITRLLAAVIITTSSAFAGVIVTRTNYLGWPDAIVLNNGSVAAVVVPSIARVMQFGFVGEEGVFWENPTLLGKIADPQLITWAAKDWVNFGGDKAWPSPEGDWSIFTNRKGWRPPPAFDGWGAEARVSGSSVTLVTAVDPFFGTAAERRIELHSRKPEMTITTTFRRVVGDPAVIGIWIVTQLREPEGVFAPLPAKSIFKDGHRQLGQTPPPSLKIENGLLSLTRNPKAAHKIGLDGDTLLWVGAKHALRIDSPRVRKGQYPDGGSSTEIYTGPDPLPYIELETLGPVQRMKEGDSIKRSNVYRLYRRSHGTPEAEARAILK